MERVVGEEEEVVHGRRRRRVALWLLSHGDARIAALFAFSIYFQNPLALKIVFCCLIPS